jgi:hypothetical protein
MIWRAKRAVALLVDCVHVEDGIRQPSRDPAESIERLLETSGMEAAAIDQPAFVTSTFAELTGAPPRTFLEWATDHAAEFEHRRRLATAERFTEPPASTVDAQGII